MRVERVEERSVEGGAERMRTVEGKGRSIQLRSFFNSVNIADPNSYFPDFHLSDKQPCHFFLFIQLQLYES